MKTARLLRLVRVARKIDRYSEYGLQGVELKFSIMLLLYAQYVILIFG